ncbi:MAG: lysophospholipid acyltransferase family protein [Victivallaceae bacterium]|nr:lysophospholipid acyltransferase family protein [Victivallaceae bacterium]
MRLWRALWRLTALLCWTLMVSMLAMIACRNTPSGIRRATWYTRLWCRGIIRTVGIRLTVHGRSSDFSGRLIISNHSSYLDIPLHGAFTRLRFAAKKEARHYPVLGPLLASGLPIWVDRENRAESSRALEAYRQSLDIGVNLLVYPEGTTSDGLGAILPFKSTAFQAVCGTSLPIQPIITRNHVAADGFNPAWYGDMTMCPHLIKMLFHRRLYCDLYILPVQYATPGETRKELAERMHSYMSEALKVIEGGDSEAISQILA